MYTQTYLKCSRCKHDFIQRDDEENCDECLDQIDQEVGEEFANYCDPSMRDCYE
jgi:hypothetical protein